MENVASILKTVSLTLKGEGFPESVREAQFMVSHLLGCKPGDLSLKRTEELDEGKLDMLARYIERRIKREPLQYILGETEFMGLPFHVTKDVLIPRPETESLVEEAMKELDEMDGVANVLDLCTGSGCIAVSIGKLYPKCEIAAIDVSRKALHLAFENATLNGVDRILFMELDFVKVVNEHREDKFRNSYDMIITNPPYVSYSDFDSLAPEVKNFEPRIALVADDNGYRFINEIVTGALLYLKKGGSLYMEVGYNQAETVASKFIQNGNYRDVDIVKDLSGIDRIVKAKVI